MTRVLIADDHPAFRRGVELMLVGVEDLDVVGGADTGQRAVDARRGSSRLTSY